jgi:hypothetical protein
MADNTTTYTAIIETQVTGADEVGDLGNKAGEADGKFKSLRSQIRDTTIALQKMADEGKTGTKEFQDLSNKLDDLGDQQQKVAFQSAQIEDKLAALPGPIGQIGKSFQAAKQSVDTFGKTIAVSLGIVGLLVSAFLAIKEALSRTEEGQAKLNKITEAFTKIMNGVFAIIEPIAMLFADLVIELLSSDKVMKALSTTAGVLSATFTTLFNVGKVLVNFIITNFVNAFKTLSEVAGGAGKVLKGVFTFDLDLIKEGVAQVGEGIKNGFKATVDNVKNTVKGIGTGIANGIKDGMEQGSKAFTAGSKRLTEAEKKAADEAAKKRAEAGKKRAEQDKKEADERAKAIAEAGKVETEAYLATLTQRDQEIYKRGQKLNADLETLEKARVAAIKEAQSKGFRDFSSIDDQYKSARVSAQEAYKLDEAAITKKYNEEDLKKAEEKTLREKELSQKAFDEFKFSQENRLQELNNRYNKEIALVNLKEQLLLCAEGLCTNDKNKIIAQSAEERVELERKKYADLLALIDEEEKKALEVIGLTEAQKTRIALDAEAQRQALTQSRRDNEILGLETELDNITTSFDRKRELIKLKEAELLAQDNLTENQRTAIRQQAADERRAIDMAELEARAEIQNAQLDLAAQFGGLLKTLAGENKKVAIAGVVVEQAAAIGKILVNTGIANAKAVAASPLTFGAPWVAINSISAALSIASSIAAGVKAIQQINSASSGGGAASGGGSIPGKTGAGAGAAPAIPQIERAAVPQITGTGGQASPGAQIAGTLAATTGKPIKAYVVSGDVTSQQALDRRTTRAATFSGGTNG